MVVSTALTFPIPLLIRQIIDRVIPERRLDELVWMGLGLVLLVILQALFAYLTQYLRVVAQETVLADVQRTLVGHVLTLPQAFFHDRPVGYLMARIRSDPAVAKDFFLGFLSILNNVLFLVIGGALLFYLDWRLALVAVAVLPALALASRGFNAKMQALCRDIQEGDALVSQELGEGLTGALTAKLLGLDSWIATRVGQALDRLKEANLRTNTLGAVAGGVLTFITAVGPVLMVVFGAYQVIQGQLTLGTVMAFVSLLTYLYGPTQSIITTRLNLQRATVAAERVFELLDEPPEPRSGPPLTVASGRLELQGVSFAYPNGKVALKDVSLRIEPAVRLAVVGRTGSGKSTLLSLLVRLFPPSRGAILIDGQDISQVSLASLRREVVLVTQDVFLFSGTVLDNIRLGNPTASEEEVRQVVSALGAQGFIAELPDGYGTVVGERGVKLSGGQRQMIALARAVLRRPTILLLDEATAALDSETEAAVYRALPTLLPTTTIVIAAHRLATIRSADWIVVLKDGEVVEQGTHDRLIERAGEYWEIFEEQVRAGLVGAPSWRSSGSS
jgi:subfamily B ATP-binding cassette protein MsbA